VLGNWVKIFTLESSGFGDSHEFDDIGKKELSGAFYPEISEERDLNFHEI
jgi:hypothetical protein